MQQKAIEKERLKREKSHMFESSTDNDYLSIIEAKRHRYIEDKLLLRDLSQKIKTAMLQPTKDPDELITQDELRSLITKGVIDEN